MYNSVDELQYLLTDHLGSVSAMLNASGSLVSGSEQRYLPLGGLRLDPGITGSDFAFTGQRNLAAVGLLDYNARWYGQTEGAFTQPDTIVPNLINSHDLNRYMYRRGNPLRFTDPTGHAVQNCVSAGGCEKTKDPPCNSINCGWVNPIVVVAPVNPPRNLVADLGEEIDLRKKAEDIRPGYRGPLLAIQKMS